MSRGQAEGYDSDDVASETSSMCSESAARSYGSRVLSEVVMQTVLMQISCLTVTSLVIYSCCYCIAQFSKFNILAF